MLIVRTKYFLLLLFLLFAGRLSAQELQCNVSVGHSKLQGTNTQVFETMRTTITEFMNETSWTNHMFDVKERIVCNIMINLTKQEGDVFYATLQVQSRRPVYNSAYNTVMLNIVDEDMVFEYVENDAIEYNPTTHVSNLSSVLSFYAYIILGFDYDSFSLKGGQEFFQVAERIVSNAQSAKEPGWKAFESSKKDNRYWLVNNIMDESYSPIRQFIYNYHRQGLDLMYDKTVDARMEIANYLKALQDVNRRKPDPFMYLLNVVIDAKETEIISIFKEGTADEKARVYRILSEIDPSKTKEYKAIVE